MFLVLKELQPVSCVAWPGLLILNFYDIPPYEYKIWCWHTFYVFSPNEVISKIVYIFSFWLSSIKIKHSLIVLEPPSLFYVSNSPLKYLLTGNVLFLEMNNFLLSWRKK